MQSDTDSENTVVTDDEESVTNTPQEEKFNKVWAVWGMKILQLRTYSNILFICIGFVFEVLL